MKRFAALFIVIMLFISFSYAATAFAAGSASATISNYTQIQAGKSYKYAITVKITGSTAFIGKITFSGVFSHDPINIDFFNSSNTSKTITNYVTFKPTASQIGKTGTISVSGSGSYLDSNGNVKEYSLAKVTRTAKVVAAPAATPTPKPTAKPAVKPAAKTAATAPGEWETAAADVAAMPEGGSLIREFKENALVPVSLLSLLKEKKGTLTADFGSYSCTIDGGALSGIPASGAVDLSLKMDKDQALSAAAGGRDVYQLHFAEQQLPGRFTFKFKADKNKPGDVLYLYYYYDKAGVIEGVESRTVDDNGFVSFPIYHCSGYFVSDAVIPATAGVDFYAQAEALESAAAMRSAYEVLSEQLRSERERETAASPAVVTPEPAPEATPGALSVSPAALISALCGAAALSAFLTMMFSRSGPFRKRERCEDDELKY